MELLILIGAFIWLGYETDWMRVRLLAGAEKHIAEYVVCQSLKGNRSGTYLRVGTNDGTGNHPFSEVTHYQVFVHPGITDILCGWDWLDKHCGDLVDYQPKVTMSMAGVRYNMTIKDTSIIKDIMKANKLTRKQKLAYA